MPRNTEPAQEESSKPRKYLLRGVEQAPGTALKPTSAVRVGPGRRLVLGSGREAGTTDFQVDGDEVAKVEMENGFVLWTRADDLIRERGRKTLGRDGQEAWEIDPRPPGGASRGERGWMGLTIKVLEFFGVDLKEGAASKLGSVAEEKLLKGNRPGIHRCSLDDPFALAAVAARAILPADKGPVLVFIHGTGSSCRGSFGKLWEGAAGTSARQALKARYRDEVYALEHRSLTASPIRNALDLVKQLPDHAELHLVSHSRGGLVGELLCLGQRDRTDDPLRPDFLDTLFAADRTIAEQLGLSPLRPEALAQRDEAYAGDRALLRTLLEQLDKKDIRVTRFVRVACPARGTTLASGRLDRWLSVLNHLTGNGWVNDGLDFLLGVVKERTDPRTLPGLEAMMPGSALTRLLQLPDLLTRADLSVIAGDIEGDSLWSQIKLLATDWFYGADHDLVVNTGSMYGGIRRPENGARFQFDRGAQVSHFNYFANDRSVRWLLAGLTREDDSDGGFRPLVAAKHEEPRWRDALRRSRAGTVPRPLAVLVPGTMGSALSADNDPVWLKYLALFKGGLARLARGRAEVTPTDLLGDFYGPLIEFLARSHKVEIHPYDWRLSVRDAADKLAARLEGWLPEFERQGQAVHLVAHSMGGLVVRAMIADGGRGTAVWRRILDLPGSRFMMLGTPNLGSHEAVRWLTGHNPTQAKLILLDIFHGTNDIIDIVKGFPGLLELLPFDPAGADFSQSALWRDLKAQLGAGWKTADARDLIGARGTWDYLRQARPDPDRMIYVAGCQEATVVDYRVTDYDDVWLAGRKRLEFIATREGDGTVAWRSGLMPGVKTWYVRDTAHDELCTRKSAFPAYLDLLVSGSTSRLPDSPPTRARASDGAPADFILAAQPPADDIPGEARLREFGFGITRPFDEAAAGRGVPVVQVSLVHGDLAYAKHPVLVGHYQGDTIVSAEKALDNRLDQALTDRLQLGLYPGPLGSHAVFFHDKAGGKPGGAVVIGLGQVGELSPGLLQKGVRDALLEYALRIAKWPDDRFGPADKPRSAPITCLLVGSGAGGMAVRDSVEAILRGVVMANEKLVAAEMEGRVLIDQVEFAELYEHQAIAAAEALESVLVDGQLAMTVAWRERTIIEGQGCLSQVRCDEAAGWWQRLEIIEERHADTLRFIATTDRARAEETLAMGQLCLVDGFVAQASRTTGANPEVAKTLFEMLLPNRLKELAPRQSNIVLLVDRLSARYPWELLEDRWSHDSKPPAVAGGLVRQFKTPRFRPHPAHAAELTAFVVGNPDLEGWESFSDLPGARKEAQRVVNLLSGEGYQTRSCIDEKADDILSGLHLKAWRILHLAGHGEHEFKLEEEAPKPMAKARRDPDADGKPPEPKYVSGMVIGKNTLLTPGDVEQMRWVPELVFINCCHLGKTQGNTARDGKFGLLAANLAVQFIEMGVKAVVAAGWAVDDGAAEAFANSFYTHLLEGDSFGMAVRAAREETWVRFPNANTWGAYQCYGDPDFRLRQGGGSGGTDTMPYHAPAELVADLRNHRERIRMRMREQGEVQEVLDSLRAGIVGHLDRIPESGRETWLVRGDVAAAIGFAWGETGAYEEAVEWLEQALRAKTGDCPMRAVEQCANFRVRLSARRWQDLRGNAGRKGVEARRAKLVEQILLAIRELDLISQRAPTEERFDLLGGACKRLAWVQDDPAPRLEALVNMANYYRRSFDLGKKLGKEERPYPFANWAVARVLAHRLDPAQGGDWRETLADECRAMIQIAEQRCEAKPNFWDGVGAADCELALLLHMGGKKKDVEEAATRIAARYRAAAQRGASPREYASVTEHLDFVLALEEAAQSPLLDALRTLRAAL